MTNPGPFVGPAVGDVRLLEREQELGAFDALLGEGAGSSLVVIEGPAGIGKSRLISEMRERAAAANVRVLSAVGSELEREFPFGVVRQLFDPVLADAADRERLLGDAAGAARAVFDEPDPGDAGREGSFAALHGLYWLTVNAGGDGPLLLAVDDLHWCDRPSLRFLAYLARRLEGLSTLLVVGLRTVDPGTDPVLIGDLVDVPGAVRLHPGPLSEAGVAELIRSRLGAEPEPAFTAACLTATGGNPLLMRQLLSSLEADGVAPEAAQADAVREIGPRAVSRTVLRRMHRLPAEAAAVAQALAVLGDGAQLPLVAMLADLDERTVAATTAALTRAEILRPEPPLGFVHPLVRDVVYHELPPGERELRHAEAARFLRSAEAPAEEIAAHLLACPRRGEAWVVEILRRAAASARARGAADSAAAFLERALEEPPPADDRARVIAELGLAETLTTGPAAATHLRDAWQTLGDPHERARVAITLARTLVFTAAGKEAVAVARQAGAELPPELVDERQALRGLELMAVPLGTGDDEQAIAALEDLRIEGDGPGAKMLAAGASLALALTGAPVDTCVPLARRALADGVLVEADHGLLPTAAGWVLVMADCEDVVAAWDGMRTQGHRLGSLFGSFNTDLWTGGLLLWRGDLPEADSTLEAALDNAAAWGLWQSGAGAYGPAFAFAGAVRLLRGDLEGARELLDPVRKDERRAENSRLTVASRAELLLAERRHEEALAVADDLAARCGRVVNPGWVPWQSVKARALDGLGRTEEAITVAADGLDRARSFGSPSVVGRALRILGTIERERGTDRLREAVELLEGSTAKLELAGALFALGAALRRENRPAEARDPLRRAIELAERCGAEPLLAEARSELYAAGGRPRRTALSGVDALTASERRVADLAAAGHTNREIAQALFVTPKTVELHLSNAYRKLEIRSRRELGEALAPA